MNWWVFKEMKEYRYHEYKRFKSLLPGGPALPSGRDSEVG